MNCFFLAYCSGLCRNELLGLIWRDLDLDLCEITVRRTLYWNTATQTYEARPPKTAYRRRTISLSPSAITLLRQHQEDQQARFALLGRHWSVDSWIFTDAVGSPVNPDSLTHQWGKIARKAGFRGVRLHDLRHTHATLMLKAGMDLKHLSQRLGHASISTTANIYTHALRELDQQAAQRFDKNLRLIREPDLERSPVDLQGFAHG